MTPENANEAAFLGYSAEALEAYLTHTLGAVVGGATLSRTLGFRSQDAFRRALARDRIPVRVFCIEGRRGRFALTRDVARWLHSQGTCASNVTTNPMNDEVSHDLNGYLVDQPGVKTREARDSAEPRAPKRSQS
jgi:hypothetical protein